MCSEALRLRKTQRANNSITANVMDAEPPVLVTHGLPGDIPDSPGQAAACFYTA